MVYICENEDVRKAVLLTGRPDAYVWSGDWEDAWSERNICILTCGGEAGRSFACRVWDSAVERLGHRWALDHVDAVAPKPWPFCPMCGGANAQRSPCCEKCRTNLVRRAADWLMSGDLAEVLSGWEAKVGRSAPDAVS